MKYGAPAKGPPTALGKHKLCVFCAYERSKWAWLRFHDKDPQTYLDEECEPIVDAFRCEACGRAVVSRDLMRRAFGGT